MTAIRKEAKEKALKVLTDDQKTTWKDLAGEPYRFLALTGFSYVIVYNADRTPPLILRILHGARDLPELLRGQLDPPLR